MRLIALLYLPCLLFAKTNQKDIADQFSSRNWSYYASESGRNARIENYFDTLTIESLSKSLSSFLESLISSDLSNLQAFYPDLNLSDEEEISNLSNYFEDELSNLDVILDWGEFESVINTDRWNDDVACDSSNPIGDVNCGRKTKGSYVLTSLTIEQLESISRFKEIIADDFKYMRSNDFEHDSLGIIRLYQFLYDYRAIDSVLSENYLHYKGTLTSFDKLKRIDLIRSLIIQLFSSENGRLENSNFVEIKLEDQSCYSSGVNLEVDCQYEYVKKLLFTEESYTSLEANNLIFDSKAIKSLLDNYVELYRSKNDIFVSETQVKNDFLRVFFALSSIYDINMEAPEFNIKTKRKLVSFLKECNIYLLNNPSTIGLQMAKSIEKLILTIEAIL